MTRITYGGCLAVSAVLAIAWASVVNGSSERKSRPLPPPVLGGHVTVEVAIAQRRSVRQFADKPLTLGQVGQLCWAGQGITDPVAGLRASPSAGALYPIELYTLQLHKIDTADEEKAAAAGVAGGCGGGPGNSPPVRFSNRRRADGFGRFPRHSSDGNPHM